MGGIEKYLLDLLERLKRTDRIVNNINDLEEMYGKDIDYNETDNIIKEETIKSIEYLKNNLIK